MNHDYITDGKKGSYTSDSVQWQGSQTACAALDSLLSEAGFNPRPEPSQSQLSMDLYPSSKEMLRSSMNNVKRTTYYSRLSSSFASTSTSLYLSSQTSGSSTSSPLSTTSSRPSTPSGPDTSLSSSTSLSEHRLRQSRSSISIRADTPPVGDTDQFLKMLKGISERIDGSFRSDASNAKDMLKRRPPSKRTASSSNSGIKRLKHDSSSASNFYSASQSSVKGKARDLNISPCASADTQLLPKATVESRINHCNQAYSVTSNAMDVDTPQMSQEIMPPPPIPRLTTNITTPALDRPSHCNPNVQSSPPTHATAPTPPSAPKLHPLLDPERKQRRLKLERTISASLASLPPESTPASKPAAQRQYQTRLPSSQPYPAAPVHSQGSKTGTVSRHPPLGMRRTNTFPSISQTPLASNPRPTAPLPVRQKAFKTPLLSSSQPSSTPSTDSFSHNDGPSSSLSSKSSPLTSNENPTSRSGNESIDDLPLSSDGDISFGDVVSLDVDMDALEETMRKYD